MANPHSDYFSPRAGRFFPITTGSPGNKIPRGLGVAGLLRDRAVPCLAISMRLPDLFYSLS
ncbi:hypothetical protein [Phormidium sp. CCY1219]|uniref:hypothetical protein n=1 Tax=Phormidium sp. CCY1219 TaxID=2886104 RepID=UPI002D1F557F|nr:hypothetical protein [Phormidium sp. CCY1219]MEB3827227.1 hypothetical protein [Phormidium sp. CCY1219]